MVQSSLAEDLLRLSELAYHRVEGCGAQVEQLHDLRKAAAGHADFELLERVCAWLWVPFTLWPIDLCGLCQVVQQRIAAGTRLEPALCLLIESLAPLPGKREQAIAAAHEHEVQRGAYDSQVKAREKYVLHEGMLLADAVFVRAWDAIKARFEVAGFQDGTGIIRRRVVSERAFRSDWNLDWNDPATRFQAAFDAFCHRWNLYGMAGNRPLLQKVTANLTPHGTMIFIPAWWSFDPKRDLDWREVMRLHKARAPTKQGSKLTRNKMAQEAEARRAAALEVKARAQGLKGEARAQWVMTHLGWKGGDARKLRLVLQRAKRASADQNRAPLEQSDQATPRRRKK